MKVSATDLNRSPAKYVELAEAGETIEVVRRGQVVAKLSPASTSQQRDPDDSGAEDDDEPFGTPEAKPVDPPAKKAVTKKAEVRESPAPVVSAPKMTTSGERREEKLERLAVMEAARKEMGIKERPSPWDMKYGKQKKTTH